MSLDFFKEEPAVSKVNNDEHIDKLRRRLYNISLYLSNQKKDSPRFLRERELELENIKRYQEFKISPIKSDIALLSHQLKEAQQELEKLKSKEIPTDDEIEIEKKENEAWHIEQLAKQDAEMSLLECKFEEERNKMIWILKSKLNTLYESFKLKFGLPYSFNNIFQGYCENFIGIGPINDEKTKEVIENLFENSGCRILIEKYMIWKEKECKIIEEEIKTIETLIFNPPVILMPISKLETERITTNYFISLKEQEIQKIIMDLTKLKRTYQDIMIKTEYEKQVIQEAKKSLIDEIEKAKNEWFEINRKLAELTNS